MKTITVRDGLIFRSGHFLNATEADDIAKANGFGYAEQFVRAHDGETLRLSERNVITLGDEDVMPFGAHKGRTLGSIKADYLLFIWDDFMHEKDWGRGRPEHAPVREYVRENFSALEMDAKDFIVTHRP